MGWVFAVALGRHLDVTTLVEDRPREEPEPQP
jgi:hypothetical protein